ncbi:hypothetical protein KSP39_PZI019255 [Platanthera zijinensis]|uniref:UBN2 domain-containing protein n=1 Tax=Platanthera zijinensis TaxID=2320716 RepID=A0AAP0B327_9ASPA
MEIDEEVDGMYTRFTKIVNASRSLGKSYSNSDLVRKILRSLPPHFNPKVTDIVESHDISTLEIESLIGNLKTNEIELTIQDEEYPREIKKKGLALKVRREMKAAEESKDDDEESLYVREFRKFMKNLKRLGMFKKLLKKGAEETKRWKKPSKETKSDDEKFLLERYHYHKPILIKREYRRL